MSTATLNGTEMFSCGHVCSVTQRGPTAVLRIAKQLGILPALSLNSIAYFNAADVDRIADRFRQLDTEQKAKDAAASKAAAIPKTLKELTAERKKLHAKYPAGFKPDKHWLRDTIDGQRWTQLDAAIENALEGK